MNVLLLFMIHDSYERTFLYDYVNASHLFRDIPLLYACLQSNNWSTVRRPPENIHAHQTFGRGLKKITYNNGD